MNFKIGFLQSFSCACVFCFRLWFEVEIFFSFFLNLDNQNVPAFYVTLPWHLQLLAFRCVPACSQRFRQWFLFSFFFASWFDWFWFRVLFWSFSWSFFFGAKLKLNLIWWNFFFVLIFKFLFVFLSFKMKKHFLIFVFFLFLIWSKSKLLNKKIFILIVNAWLCQDANDKEIWTVNSFCSQKKWI